jgi:glycosyltransferase involved in cell wall biosynthesis
VRRLQVTSSDTSVALIQRQADYLPTLKMERLAARDRRVVWDVDDAIWYDTSRSAIAHPLAALKRTRSKVRWLASHADHVIAANATLASYLDNFATRITIVPSLVETRQMRVRAHINRDDYVVGWIGSRSTATYLNRMTNTLHELARALPERTIIFVVVGGRAPPVDGVEVRCHPWSFASEREALEFMDVGIVPQPNDIWTQGKSAYKAIQYMAAGIPVIADDVGVAKEAIGDGGFVVQGSDEWLEALVEAGKDANLRAALGRRGRRRVEQKFSVVRWAPKVAAILRGDV